MDKPTNYLRIKTFLRSATTSMLETELNMHTNDPANRAAFSWSHSRSKTFNSCRRAYYYGYYAANKAWDKYGKIARAVWLLKKQETVPLILGSVVHKYVGRALKAALRGKLDVESIVGAAKREYITALTNPEMFPEYSNKFAKATVDTSELEVYLHAAIDSDIFIQVAALPPENVLEVDEEFQTHDISDVIGQPLTIYAIPDVLYKDESGGIVILDWKTGTISKEESRTQAAVYKLYASLAYNVKFEDVTVWFVALKNKRKLLVAAPDMSREEIIEHIKTDSNQMRDVLTAEGLAPIENFPMTENVFKCAYCNYKDVCHR